METIYNEVNQIITKLTGQQGEQFEVGAFSGVGYFFIINAVLIMASIRGFH